ncbi:MAG: rhodanese-like domain-containing protein [Hyphomicrobium sp.]|jgi:rhodanese-related sulfurtransferase
MVELFAISGARELSPQDAHALMSRGEILLVDVRDSPEWSQQHVPGAVNLPLSELAARFLELPRDKTVVFFCRSGQRSGRAVDLCRRMNVPHDAHVTGGILAWLAAGLPVSS